MATYITYENISGNPIVLYSRKGVRDYSLAKNAHVQYRVGDDDSTKGVSYGRVILEKTGSEEIIPLSQLKNAKLFKAVKQFSTVYLMNEDTYLMYWNHKASNFASYGTANDMRFLISKGSKITLSTSQNKKTKFFELDKDPVIGICYRVENAAAANAWISAHALTKDALEITQYLQDFGEALGIGGDFQYSPDAVEDVYAKGGIEMPLTLSEVKKEVFNTPLPKPDNAVVIKGEEVKVAEPAKVSSTVLSSPKTQSQVPEWAKVLLVAGIPIGLIYAARKDKGFWGFVGAGLVGSIICGLPYNYYNNKDREEGLDIRL